MQQGSVLEGGRHGLCPCHHLKGRHKIQSSWENREYVVEWQPYPNLPVYEVHHIHGEGCSCTLQRNYLLPISHNLEQEEGGNAMEGDGSNKPTPVWHMEDALPVNHPTKSQLEGIPNTPSKQHELAGPESTGSTSPYRMDEGLQADDDTYVPLRQSSRTTRN